MSNAAANREVTALFVGIFLKKVGNASRHLHVRNKPVKKNRRWPKKMPPSRSMVSPTWSVSGDNSGCCRQVYGTKGAAVMAASLVVWNGWCVRLTLQAWKVHNLTISVCNKLRNPHAVSQKDTPCATAAVRVSPGWEEQNMTIQEKDALRSLVHSNSVRHVCARTECTARLFTRLCTHTHTRFVCTPPRTLLAQRSLCSKHEKL